MIQLTNYVYRRYNLISSLMFSNDGEDHESFRGMMRDKKEQISSTVQHTHNVDEESIELSALSSNNKNSEHSDNDVVNVLHGER